MTAAPLLVRPEQVGDERRIHDLHAAAFRDPGQPAKEPVEAKLVDDLRASTDWIPKLSLVAILDSEIVGHVVCSRATLLPDRPVLGLGDGRHRWIHWAPLRLWRAGRFRLELVGDER